MQHQFEAIGTHWVLDIIDDLSAQSTKELLQAIASRIEQFDSAYSRFRKDSLVSLMAQEKGVYELPEDAEPLLEFYRKLYILTEGKFTPLIGNTLEQAGYDAEYSLMPQELSKPPEWDDAINITFPKIEILEPTLLDVGAAGKGYLVDIVSEIMLGRGVKSFCVDAGGDIVHRSIKNEPLRVGLENPFDVTQAIGVAEIVNQSLCASAGNRRQWEGYNHIINPQTLTSTTEIAAVWVVAESGLIADGLATALFFSKPAVLSKEFSFEYLILNQDSSVKKSENFSAELFYK